MSHYNRLFDSTGEKALNSANRLKLDIWKDDAGTYVEYEIHGSIGDLGCRDDEGGLKEAADLSLLRELLERFERKDGDL